MVKNACKQLILRSGGLALASRLRAPEVVILRYHSVLEVPAEFGDSIGSGIIHERVAFEQQMTYLARTCQPLSMDEVLAFLGGRGPRLRRRAVAVTFDDGFADNLSVAAPILERWGVPGAIYIAVDYVAGLPWYCRLRYAFSRSPKAAFVHPATGAAWAMATAAARREAFLDSSRRCACLPRSQIEAAIVELERELEAAFRPSRAIMLDWDQVRELLRRGHTIGSHSLSHPNLAQVPIAEAKMQMEASRSELRARTCDAIRHFSYPSPILEPHWSEATWAASADAGYETAVTCTPRAARADARALALPRLSAPGELEQFVWMLENAFAGRIT